jgi:SAM-dependent methyltransferase
MEYNPEGYWEQRLGSDFSLRGTGHASFSPAYNGWVYRRKAHVLAAALTSVSNGDSALDIGSGVGWVIRQLLDRGLNVEGCDITDVAIQRLGEQYPGVGFFKAAVGSEPIPRDPASYDLVTMLDVAYHITDDDIWSAAVSDIARVLKPNGICVITDRFGEHRAQVSEHVLFRSRADWEREGVAAGMRISNMGGLYTWLSRPANAPGWRRLPDTIRGPIEYLRDERIRQGAPHLRWAVLTRDD